MRVLVAPDKFRGSLSARQAAAAITRGVLRTWPDADLEIVAVADGGEGTVDAVLGAGYSLHWAFVHDPWGNPTTARLGARGRSAVVELAQASGHGPGGALDASTYGTGEVLLAAGDVERVTLGLGGSATTDGGTGLARALGARFLDAAGRDLPPGGGSLTDLARIVPGPAFPAQLVLATDVTNPLLGPSGAAAVFAPQKGASPADVEVLEAGLQRLAEVLEATTGVDVRDLPGAGAAGGVPACAVALLGGVIRPGVELLLELVGFAERVRGADLVITGEGRLDAQSLQGKAPVGVARAAGDVPVIALCGRVDVGPVELAAAGISSAWSLADVCTDPGRWMPEAAELLTELAEVATQAQKSGR